MRCQRQVQPDSGNSSTAAMHGTDGSRTQLKQARRPLPSTHLVDRQAHAATEHVHLSVAQRNVRAGLHHLHCGAERFKVQV